MDNKEESPGGDDVAEEQPRSSGEQDNTPLVEETTSNDRRDDPAVDGKSRGMKVRGKGKSAAKNGKKESKFSTLMARWKLYAQISELGLVARRFFVKNMTDGILTTLGVVIGSMVAFLSGNPELIPQVNLAIVLPGIGTAVAMCVSGVLASYLTESAERRKALLELQQDMVILEDDDEPKEHGAKKGTKKKKTKTLQEKAERFATITASLIDGFSPFAAALVVLIPFYFPGEPSLWLYLASIILTCILLFLLGSYLGKLSKMNYVIYGIKMTAMGLLTLIITIALGQI
ncbi:MAG: VIT1/CCC1 transporter family protein [Promethearchaeota archaeon]